LERDAILLKFKSILENKLGVHFSEITESSHLINDLGADSLDVIEILMECESLFDISIPEGDVENLFTVKELVDYGYGRLSG